MRPVARKCSAPWREAHVRSPDEDVGVGMNWGGIFMVGGDLAEQERPPIQQLLNGLADAVASGLAERSLPPTASPIFRNWSLVVARTRSTVVAVFARPAGTASQHWLDRSANTVDPNEAMTAVQQELGLQPLTAFELPLPGAADVEAQLARAAEEHLEEVDRANVFRRLGDLSGLTHLEPGLRSFLGDHPEPARNVFIMMRFLETDQMRAIHQAIVRSLATHGFHGVRADDRDYTGELWSNVEVCMVGCHYGIAVFEDIERRDFNPNVSLELGYMLGRQRRCLLLKERRLPDLPTDVVHRLYKPFDAFEIEATISAQVNRWLETDLRISDAQHP